MGRGQVDFLIFTLSSILFFGVLISVLGDIAISMYDSANELEMQMNDRRESDSYTKYGYGGGAIIIALYGSKFFAGAALLGAILLWNFMFRIAIKMPAHVEGNEMTQSQALFITQYHSTEIMAVSLIFNVILASLVFFALPLDMGWFERSVVICFVSWLFVHVNMSMLVATYWKICMGMY